MAETFKQYCEKHGRSYESQTSWEHQLWDSQKSKIEILERKLERAERYLNLAYINNKSVFGILEEFEKHHKTLRHNRHYPLDE